MPRNNTKPITSVKVVTKAADDIAGSILRWRGKSGTRAPNIPATSIFPNIANPNTNPSVKFPFQRYATNPTTIPKATPWISPRASSQDKSRSHDRRGTSPKAMLRTTKVTAWVPPIPPWLATTGRKTSRAITFVIVSSKGLTITAAKKAVARLM